MNISGIVVKTAPEHVGAVVASLKSSGLCDVYFEDGAGRIVVTVEGKDTSEEIRKMREIMNLEHVLCADLAYSYSENETELDLGAIERQGQAVPEALRSASPVE